ncbi:hypothetical protein SaSA201_1615 [Streptococcus agalactiae]|nr:hypothetical protein SaSA53_1608 [Streptococcus agalactiae]AUO92563.1 hypothetical protein SaSA16_1610 [Streptococcus agalactiae]AUO97567.1 hypothetical protein SaSA81_1609 [Streptococcus agalactiae]AUP00866.1 hypothetical protein SaSA95_1615 [Streptococcus agalactiae]AUP10365.1 hypothetical protein SaSA184_1617 [Streptococcus agalactiae]
MSFLEELKNRRSIYALGRNTEVSDEKIVEIIKEAVRNPHLLLIVKLPVLSFY